MTKLQQRLKSGEIAWGLCLTYPAPGIIERLHNDWDWLWIDCQHGQIDYDCLIHFIRVADCCDIPAIIRVPGHEYSVIGPVMDMASAGIMTPMIETAEDAERIVEAMYFPPLGKRSFGGRRVLDVLGRGYRKTANDNTLFVADIETVQGVRNAEAIASVEGVDVLFLGPEDLRVSLDLDVDIPITESEELIQAMEDLSKAAHNHGKMLGIAGVDGKALKIALSLGYRLIASAADMVLLRRASQTIAQQLRNTAESCRPWDVQK